MSFSETAVTYRRKPETVRAARVTPDGLIGIKLNWIERLIAEKRLAWGGQNWWANPATIGTRAAYPGDWIVLHDGSEALEVMSDERFRALYEGYDVEEEVDA